MTEFLLENQLALSRRGEPSRFHIGIDHDRNQVLEMDARLPSKFFMGFRAVSNQSIYF